MKTGRYVAVCGITIALNIVCIMLLCATPLDVFGCILCVAVMTPLIAKIGWKRTFPVYVATAILGSMFMNPELTLIYFCVGFHPFGADTDHYGSRYIPLKILMHCLVMGMISTLLMLGVSSLFGLTEYREPGNILLLFPGMILIAFSQGVIYRSVKRMIYQPILKPMLDNIFDD